MAARATSPTPGTAVVNLAAWRAWLADELASASAANEAAATAAVSEVLSTLDASREALALIRNPGGGDAVELQLLGEPLLAAVRQEWSAASGAVRAAQAAISTAHASLGDRALQLVEAVATLPAIVGRAAVPAAARTAAEQVRAMEEAALAAEDPDARGEFYGGW